MRSTITVSGKKIALIFVIIACTTVFLCFEITTLIINGTKPNSNQALVSNSKASEIVNTDSTNPETIFSSTDNTPDTETKGILTEEAASDRVTSIEVLDQQIRDLIDANKKKGLEKAGVVIFDKSTGEKLDINGDDQLTSASLYKLFVLWKVQEEIEKGTISDDTNLILSASNDGSGDDGFTLGAYGTAITINYARQIMIENSNNTASIALAQKVGWNNIQTMLNDHGFTKTRLNGLPKLTAPNDVYKYLHSVTDSSLSPVLKSKDYTLILDLLKKQKIRTNLSPGLPKDVTFAHKTGNVYDFVHDAGILYLPDGREIIIVAMSKGNVSTDFAFLKSLGQLIWATFLNYK